PPLFTVATPVFPLDHVTGRFNGLFDASSGVAVSCTVPPCWIVSRARDMTTLATGTLTTVMMEAPVTPSLVANTESTPTATAVTVPEPLTVAIDGDRVVHVISLPVSVFPTLSLVTADRVTCVPTWRVSVRGEVATDATGIWSTSRSA